MNEQRPKSRKHFSQRGTQNDIEQQIKPKKTRKPSAEDEPKKKRKKCPPEASGENRWIDSEMESRRGAGISAFETGERPPRTKTKTRKVSASEASPKSQATKPIASRSTNTQRDSSKQVMPQTNHAATEAMQKQTKKARPTSKAPHNGVPRSTTNAQPGAKSKQKPKTKRKVSSSGTPNSKTKPASQRPPSKSVGHRTAVETSSTKTSRKQQVEASSKDASKSKPTKQVAKPPVAKKRRSVKKQDKRYLKPVAICYNLFLFTLLLIVASFYCLFIIVQSEQTIFDYRLIPVVDQSMVTEMGEGISSGDLVLVKKASLSELREGDLVGIQYVNTGNTSVRRFVGLEQDDEQESYYLLVFGDNPAFHTVQEVAPDQLIGKVKNHFSNIGRLLGFIESNLWTSFLFFFVLFLFLILLEKLLFSY